jgi:uncharacterized membrane protein YeaQ/YmgE (transglycosylase-associated protein family)
MQERSFPFDRQKVCEQWSSLGRNGGDDMTIFALLIIGIIAGWIAITLIGRGGYGTIGDMVVGILGSAIGGGLAIHLLGTDVIGINLTCVATGVFGAVILTIVFRALVPGRREMIVVFR